MAYRIKRYVSPFRRIFLATVFVLLTLGIFPAYAPAADAKCGCCEEELLHADSARELEAVIERLQPCELAFVAVQRLAASALEDEDWPAAAEIFRRYRDRFPQMSARFSRLEHLLTGSEENLPVAGLGSGVNSRGPDFRPVLSADGRMLFFGRERGADAGGEDIYVSRLERDTWRKADNIGPPLSTLANEMPLAIAADNSRLVVFGNYEGSLGRGDIFYSVRGKECWGPVRPYPPPVNSKHFDSDAMLTADGRAMLFISDRPGGIGAYHPKGELFHGGYAGNTDIYVYVPGRGGPGEVINLGEAINTPYAEYSPFLHPDGRTLYFSSDGHGGLGGLDVFKSTRADADSWTEWSEPVNLGRRINGPFHDWGYQIATAGDRAYFASRRIACGGDSDIFAVELPPEIRPGPVVAVSGRVLDPDGHPLQAELKWNDLTVDKPAGRLESEPGTGRYFIALPAGHRYGYHADKPGYMGASSHLDLTGVTESTEIERDIILQPLEALSTGTVAVPLHNIFFDYDRYSLRPESFRELDRWVDFLKQNKELQATIEGHADHIGTEAYNQTLSERRARSVADYLVEQGVKRERLAVAGYGENRPIASNATAQGRQQNRRVEIRFRR